MSKGRLSGEGRPPAPPLTEPPPWVRVTRHRTSKQSVPSALVGQVVKSVERDWGSMQPAIFVLHIAEDGTETEHKLFDEEWETP